MLREPSPPPVKDPIQDDEDDDRWNWYYDDPGGGTELWFGKHVGRKLNQTSWSYLQWCIQNLSFIRKRFRLAFDVYYNGLCAMADDDYGRFVVPFGNTYRGLEIRQCRDKPWLLWTLGRPKLLKKYPIFFRAARNWVNNPRKYGVTRDIGELLHASKYEDDLDLEREDEEEDYSDLGDFIVSDPASDVESDDGDESTQSDSEEPEAVATEGETTSRAEDTSEESDSASSSKPQFWQSSRTRSGKVFKQPNQLPLEEESEELSTEAATAPTDYEISVLSSDEWTRPSGHTRSGVHWKTESFREWRSSINNSNAKTSMHFRSKKRQREDSEAERDIPKKRTGGRRLLRVQSLLPPLKNTPIRSKQQPPRSMTSPRKIRRISIESLSESEDDIRHFHPSTPKRSKRGATAASSSSSSLPSPSLLTRKLAPVKSKPTKKEIDKKGLSNYSSPSSRARRNVGVVDLRTPSPTPRRDLMKRRYIESEPTSEEEEIPRPRRFASPISVSSSSG